MSPDREPSPPSPRAHVAHPCLVVEVVAPLSEKYAIAAPDALCAALGLQTSTLEGLTSLSDMSFPRQIADPSKGTGNRRAKSTWSMPLSVRLHPVLIALVAALRQSNVAHHLPHPMPDVSIRVWLGSADAPPSGLSAFIVRPVGNDDCGGGYSEGERVLGLISSVGELRAALEASNRLHEVRDVFPVVLGPEFGQPARFVGLMVVGVPHRAPPPGFTGEFRAKGTFTVPLTLPFSDSARTIPKVQVAACYDNVPVFPLLKGRCTLQWSEVFARFTPAELKAACAGAVTDLVNDLQSPPHLPDPDPLVAEEIQAILARGARQAKARARTAAARVDPSRGRELAAGKPPLGPPATRSVSPMRRLRDEGPGAPPPAPKVAKPSAASSPSSSRRASLAGSEVEVDRTVDHLVLAALNPSPHPVLPTPLPAPALPALPPGSAAARSSQGSKRAQALVAAASRVAAEEAAGLTARVGGVLTVGVVPPPELTTDVTMTDEDGSSRPQDPGGSQ